MLERMIKTIANHYGMKVEEKSFSNHGQEAEHAGVFKKLNAALYGTRIAFSEIEKLKLGEYIDSESDTINETKSRPSTIGKSEACLSHVNEVFLGGTYGGYQWRPAVCQELVNNGIRYFNPVVDDWTEQCIVEEENAKKNMNIHLYVITDAMVGCYSVVEACVSMSNPAKKTIIVFADTGKMQECTRRSFNASIKLLQEHASNEASRTGIISAYVHSEINNTNTLPIEIARIIANVDKW